MMQPKWSNRLNFDPIAPLLSCNNEAVYLYTLNDLLDDGDKNYKQLRELPLARSIVAKQQPDGSWLYPGGNQKIRTTENYNQLETYRNLGYLVEMFGFDKSSPVIAAAAEFLFSFQTKEGDIRGILGNQYTPYYTAAIAELLIKAGYENDERITRIFTWLKLVRQNDGGWTIPLRTHNKTLDIIAMKSPTLEPVRSKPSSHMVTGIVLRAYAAHPTYRHSTEAQSAGELLLSRLFKRDKYSDRASADFWLRFTYPFWFTDLISALDSLTKLGFTTQDLRLAKAVDWLIENQSSDGLWHLKTLKNQKKFTTDLWISLAICRILKRL